MRQSRKYAEISTAVDRTRDKYRSVQPMKRLGSLFCIRFWIVFKVTCALGREKKNSFYI